MTVSNYLPPLSFEDAISRVVIGGIIGTMGALARAQRHVTFGNSFIAAGVCGAFPGLVSLVRLASQWSAWFSPQMEPAVVFLRPDSAGEPSQKEFEEYCMGLYAEGECGLE